MQVLYNPRKFGLTAPYDVVTVTPPYEEVVYADLITALSESDVSTSFKAFSPTDLLLLDKSCRPCMHITFPLTVR